MIVRRRLTSAVRSAKLIACLAALLACWPARDSLAVSEAKFFKPPKQAPAQLDPSGIYPLGQQFPIGLYSIAGTSKIDPQMTNMHRAAENGFTLAGPYYGDNWQDFSPIYSAASEGMKFTFQIRPPSALVGVPYDQRAAVFDKLTDAEMAVRVREQVTSVLSDPVAASTVARWSLGTEEIRYWTPAEMRYLSVASETIRAVEQQFNVPHRPFWMYEPGHRNASALKKTGAYQDIVSKGTYLTALARGLERSGFAMWSYSQILSAAKKLKTLPQAVLQLSTDFTDPQTGTNPAEIRRVLRHDAYLALVMGIKSLNIWSMVETRSNLTTHNEQFQAYASVAQDLTGDLNLQQAFLFGERRKDLKIKVISGLDEFKYTDLYGDKFKFDTLHYLNTAVGADRYLLLVNSTEQPMDVSIKGLPSSFLMDDLFAGTTTQVNQTSLIQRLDVLGVMALRFRQLVAPVAGAGISLGAVPEPSAAILAALAASWLLSSRRPRKNRVAFS